MKRLMMMILVLASTGCATSFTGSAHVEEGRAGCERKCQGQGLAMSGMVYMGEYSSACVCEVPGATGGGSAAAGGASAGAAAGVVMQMRRAEQQQYQSYN
jgi:hypothetical protein